MTIKHTRSTSGRTHRLTHQSADTGNWKKIPGKIRTVEIRYETPPQFDDQVQGDLFRKFEREYPGVLRPIGMLPVHRDLALDREEQDRDESRRMHASVRTAPERERPTAEAVAAISFERVTGKKWKKRRRHNDVDSLIYDVALAAIRLDRKLFSETT